MLNTIDFSTDTLNASHFKRNIIYSGLAAHRLPQRRWRVATRHTLIDGNAILVLGKGLNCHECTNGCIGKGECYF
jgi:hypothetical protein